MRLNLAYRSKPEIERRMVCSALYFNCRCIVVHVKQADMCGDLTPNGMFCIQFDCRCIMASSREGSRFVW